MSATKQSPYLEPLISSAYLAYTSNLHGGGWSKFAFFKEIDVGMLVMEVSSMHRRDYDWQRIGYLTEICEQPFHSDDLWEEVKADYEKRPMEKAWKIKLLVDGREFIWTNAMFVRVPVTFREIPLG